MQKKIIALAVAGLMSGAAFAQSNVEIYGIVDMGYARASSDQAGNSKNLFQSGMLSDSRIGFKGTEDLGGGMKANFTIETNLAVDQPTTGTSGTAATTGGANPSSQLGDRTATVGLSGNFGAVNMGRQYTPIFNVMAANDVSINSAIVSDFGNMGATARSNNSIKYTSPTFSGFTAQILWSAGGSGAAGNDTNLTKDDDETGYSLAYAGGALTAGVAQHITKGVGFKNKETAYGASYDFKVVKLFGLYVKDKDTDNTAPDVRTIQLQAAFGVGPGTMVLSYMDRNDNVNANGDSKAYGVAYLYPLSKRTTAYAAYGKRTNDSAVASGGTTFTGGLNKGVAAQTAGFDPSLLGIGLRHTF